VQVVIALNRKVNRCQDPLATIGDKGIKQRHERSGGGR
jgi:hypothetical protein